jgi:gliding motility-associated-like protein
MALNDNTDIISGCDVLLTLDAGEIWETTFDTPTILETSGPALVAQFVSSLECGSLGTGDPNMRFVLPANRANLNLKLENTNGFLQTFGPEIEFFFLHLVMPTSETANIEVNGSPVFGWTEFPDFPGLSYAYWVVNDISVQALNVQSTTPFWSQYVALGMADAMTMATGTMATMEIPNQNTEVVDLGPDLTICPGQEIVLDPGINADGIWQDGSTSETFIVTEPGIYSVTISGACDDGFDEIVITEAETVEIDLEPTFSICPGGETIIEVTDPGNLEYTWSTGQSGPSITVTSAGIYTVTASVDGFCESEASTEVLESDEPELLISGTTELCVGGTGLLATSGDDGDVIWSDGETGNTLAISGPGTYTATLTTADGCEASSTYIVESIPGPDLSVSGPDAICNGEVATLVASGESGTFTWGDGTNGPELEINIGGVYTVLLTNEDGCFSEAQFRVDALSDPIIIKPLDLSFCEGVPVAITISSPNGMAFWPDFSEGSVLDVTEPGIYQIAASNECGQVIETLEVEFIDCSCPVYIPNAFTPNEDGLNDIFRPSLGCPVRDYEFDVYNRWGQLVFSTTDPDIGWNGASVKDGNFFGDGELYIYFISFQNARQPLLEREVYRGHISLIR